LASTSFLDLYVTGVFRRRRGGVKSTIK
jgi:hypothetical protein